MKDSTQGCPEERGSKQLVVAPKKTQLFKLFNCVHYNPPPRKHCFVVLGICLCPLIPCYTRLMSVCSVQGVPCIKYFILLFLVCNFVSHEKCLCLIATPCNYLASTLIKVSNIVKVSGLIYPRVK